MTDNQPTFDFVFSKVDREVVRLDSFVFQLIETEMPAQYSRSQIADSIKAKGCQVNGKMCLKPSLKVKEGDVIKISIQTPKANITGDSSVQFEILHEDLEVLVISKPSNLVVHPAPGLKESTLVHGLFDYLKKKDEGGDLDEPERLGIVHRLDKDTTGVMVIAKTMRAKRNLQRQLQPPRSMKRKYHAIVWGDFKRKKGLTESYDELGQIRTATLKVPLARHPKNRVKYTAEFNKTHSPVRDSETHFKILKSSKGFHILECELMTGRTHQIRVHLEYLGLTLLGDPLYTRPLSSNELNKIPILRELKGQMLHARNLAFIHPSSGDLMDFVADYPDQFKEVLEIIGLS